MEEVEKFKEEAERLFKNYIEHRHRGELWKAGEYLWATLQALLLGLARAMGKEIAAKHGALRRFTIELADVVGDTGILDAFKDGERLHANFYHPGLLDDEEVIEAIVKLESYVEKLSELLERELKRLSCHGT